MRSRDGGDRERVQHLTRAQTLDACLLLDVTDVACDMGFDMIVHCSADVALRYGAAGLRDVMTVVARSTALLDGPEPVTIEMHVGPLLCIACKPWGDGWAATVTLPDPASLVQLGALG